MARKSLSGFDINAPLLLTGSAGTSGYVLTSAGATGTPTWSSIVIGSTTVLGGTAATSIAGLTSLSSGTLTANSSTTSSATTGAINYGTLGYSDTNHLAIFQSSVNSYNQVVVQNTNAGVAASADFVITNDKGTASTFYGNLGMNSSGFTGTGSLNLSNAVYLTATSGDLVLGTTTANAIHIVTNAGITDAVSIASSGAVTINGTLSLGTALAYNYGGTGQSTWAKGDLLYASTSTSLARLTISTNDGYVLTANATSGLAEWRAASSGSSGFIDQQALTFNYR